MAGIHFVSVLPALQGHELCTGDSYVTNIGPHFSGNQQSAHPNKKGQDAIAQLVASQLGYASSGLGSNAAAITQEQAARTALPAAMVSPADGTPLTVTQDVPNDATAGAPFDGYMSAAGGQPPYSYAVTAGSLPAGLSLDSLSGSISSVPTAIGSTTATVTVTDSSNPPSTVGSDVSILVGSPPPLTLSTDMPDAAEATYYFAAVDAQGGLGPYSYAVADGNLPPGLTLDSTNGSVSGEPASSGSYSFTVGVTDSEPVPRPPTSRPQSTCQRLRLR